MKKNFVRLDPGTSWSPVRLANHYTKVSVVAISAKMVYKINRKQFGLMQNNAWKADLQHDCQHGIEKRFSLKTEIRGNQKKRKEKRKDKKRKKEKKKKYTKNIPYEFSRNTQSWQCWHFCTTSNVNKLETVKDIVHFKVNLHSSWCYKF